MLDRTLVSFVALLLVVGCESAVEGGGGDGGSGHGAGGSGGGVAPECEAFLNEAPTGPSVAITLRNDLPDAIRLVSYKMCSFTEYFFAVHRSDGTPGSYPDMASCAWHVTCEGKMDGQTCPGACGMPAMLCLEAGEQTELSWPAYLYEPASPPVTCDAGGSCLVLRSAAEASYVLDTSAVSVAGSATDDCLSRAEIETGLNASTQISYPATTAATLVFE